MAKILSVPIYDLIAPELSINYTVDAEAGELKKEERIQKTILLFVDAIKEREYNEQFAAMKSYFDKLNATGRDKAVEQICILTHVPEYCSQEDDMNGKL